MRGMWSCIGACFVGAMGASAQTTLPHFFFFQGTDVDQRELAQPPGFEADPRMTGMVSVNVASGRPDHDPLVAAGKIMSQIRTRLADPRMGWLNRSDIAVSLTGLAHPWTPLDQNDAINTAIRDPSDPMIPRPGQTFTWPQGFDSSPGSQTWWAYMLLHPWMDATRARLRGWTESFVAEILHRHAADGTPLPRRFVLDTEPPLFSCCEIEWSYNLDNVMKDARWTTSVVPGFSPPATMAQLLERANAEYGYDVVRGDGTALNPGFDPASGGPQTIRNRPLSFWYGQTISRIRAAMLREVAYEPIRGAYRAYFAAHPHERGFVPILSNYGDYLTDGEWDVFGWFEDKVLHTDERTGGQSPEYASYDIRTRVGHRTSLDRNNEGARQGHTMISRAGSLVWAQERWAMSPTMNWGDRDSMSLYEFRVIPSPFYTNAQQNLYLPGQPLEELWQTCMRLNRRVVESVLNSTNPEHTPRVMPYIRVPGDLTDYGHLVREDDTRQLLAMLRAKNIDEIVPFTEQRPSENLAVWRSIRSLYRQVWAYRLTDYTWTRGELPTDTFPRPRDLCDTLRVPGMGDATEAVTSATSRFDPAARTASTQIETVFKPLLDTRGDALRVTVECQITSDRFNPYAAGIAEGSVWLWDFSAPAGGRWRQLNIGEGMFDPAAYAFATPDRSTRRSFDLYNAARFFGPDRQVRVMLRHAAPAEDEFDGFRSSYDLVQVTLLNETGPGATQTAPAAVGGCPWCVTVMPDACETGGLAGEK